MKTYDYVLGGALIGLLLFGIAALSYLVPPMGISVVIGAAVGYLYSKPKWINKFWKQKEYRE